VIFSFWGASLPQNAAALRLLFKSEPKEEESKLGYFCFGEQVC